MTPPSRSHIGSRERISLPRRPTEGHCAQSRRSDFAAPGLCRCSPANLSAFSVELDVQHVESQHRALINLVQAHPLQHRQPPGAGARALCVQSLRDPLGEDFPCRFRPAFAIPVYKLTRLDKEPIFPTRWSIQVTVDRPPDTH